MANEGNVENVCRQCMVERAKASMRSHSHMHKICVPIPEDSIWDMEAEWFWAEQQEDGTYELCNVPFYAYGLSMHDVVSVRSRSDGTLEFESVLKRGGHSTYRVIASKGLRSSKVKRMLAKIRKLGCDIEPANRVHAGIDVEPQADIYAVYSLLEKGERDGIWKFEEGYCGHTLKTDQ